MPQLCWAGITLKRYAEPVPEAATGGLLTQCDSFFQF